MDFRPASRQRRGLCSLGLGLLLVLPPTAAQTEGWRERLQERRAERQAAREPSDTGGLDPRAPITRPGDHRFTIRHGGLERQYLVHLPRAYRPGTPAPLLVSMHGGGGHMEFQADDERYGQISLSEREGVIVAFPNGYSRLPGGRFATWNAGSCCGAAHERGIDDVGFIRTMVGHLLEALTIDRARIYATGMSNGGLMAYRLACEASDLFSAIAPVAGTDNTTACAPAQPVSVLHIHARDDDHVPYAGGRGSATREEAQGSFTSVPDTVARWIGRDGCPAEAERVLERPGARCERHAPCRQGTAVQVCVTEEGGHSWPGGTRRRRGEPPSRAIDANEEMWAFFLAHPRRP